MFTDLFYLLRARGLMVTMNEWLSLMEALERGLCRNSLLEFYYVSRAILVKTEADFDKFDEIFLEYFNRIEHIEDVSDELMKWLHDPKNMKKYDKDEVDARTTLDLEKLRQLLEERLKEQHERHDGSVQFDKEEYHKNFGLTAENVAKMKENAIIMHPAPFNRGVEIADDVVECEKARIFKQMSNGVYVRMAVLKRAVED